jgi:hypothetical protein
LGQVRTVFACYDCAFVDEIHRNRPREKNRQWAGAVQFPLKAMQAVISQQVMVDGGKH